MRGNRRASLINSSVCCGWRAQMSADCRESVWRTFLCVLCSSAHAFQINNTECVRLCVVLRLWGYQYDGVTCASLRRLDAKVSRRLVRGIPFSRTHTCVHFKYYIFRCKPVCVVIARTVPSREREIRSRLRTTYVKVLCCARACLRARVSARACLLPCVCTRTRLRKCRGHRIDALMRGAMISLFSHKHRHAHAHAHIYVYVCAQIAQTANAVKVRCASSSAVCYILSRHAQAHALSAQTHINKCLHTHTHRCARAARGYHISPSTTSLRRACALPVRASVLVCVAQALRALQKTCLFA